MTSTLLTLWKIEWNGEVGQMRPRVRSQVFTIRESRGPWDCPGLSEFFSLERAAAEGWHKSEALAIAAELADYDAERRECARREKLVRAMATRRAKGRAK